MKSQIISIGDELLIGQVVNTNAAAIARKINTAGVEVVRVLTVGDDEREILAALESSWSQFDITLVTGGLGPTHDDITRNVICEFFKTDLVQDPAVLEHIRALLTRRNFPWTKMAEDQALVPRGCTVVPNTLGTAPGMLFERDGKYCIVMPGVPYEMERMMDDFVVPFFRTRSRTSIIHRTIKTTGISESGLAQKLGNIGEMIGGARLAFLPSPTGVRLRITHVGNDAGAGEETVRRIEAQIREKAGKYIYGIDEEDIEEMLGAMLRDRGLTIAVAESMTGGMITNRLTNISGSSACLMYGVVSYSNESKSRILGVDPELIRQHGAVSREVAEAMAAGVRKLGGTSIGLSTTGIAGPTGGSPEKPVGLVWVGYSSDEETTAIKFTFGEGRIRVKERASQAAMDLVRRKILKIE